jgi:hypothetical protein
MRDAYNHKYCSLTSIADIVASIVLLIYNNEKRINASLLSPHLTIVTIFD